MNTKTMRVYEEDEQLLRELGAPFNERPQDALHRALRRALGEGRPERESGVGLGLTGASLPHGGVIVVSAIKGGVGTTTVAAGLAAGLAAANQRTLLLDLNPDGAAAHDHFRATIERDFGSPDQVFETKGIHRLAAGYQATDGRLTEGMLADTVVPLSDNRMLWLLPGVERPVSFEAARALAPITHTFLQDVVDLASARAGGFLFVVIDAGTSWWGRHLRADLAIVVGEAADDGSCEDELAVVSTTAANGFLVANKTAGVRGLGQVGEIDVLAIPYQPEGVRAAWLAGTPIGLSNAAVAIDIAALVGLVTRPERPSLWTK